MHFASPNDVAAAVTVVNQAFVATNVTLTTGAKIELGYCLFTTGLRELCPASRRYVVRKVIARLLPMLPRRAIAAFTALLPACIAAAPPSDITLH